MRVAVQFGELRQNGTVTEPVREIGEGRDPTIEQWVRQLEAGRPAARPAPAAPAGERQREPYGYD